MKRIAFTLAYWLTLPVLQTGSDLAHLYRRYYYARPLILIVWAPTRLLGCAGFALLEALA